MDIKANGSGHDPAILQGRKSGAGGESFRHFLAGRGTSAVFSPGSSAEEDFALKYAALRSSRASASATRLAEVMHQGRRHSAAEEAPAAEETARPSAQPGPVVEVSVRARDDLAIRGKSTGKNWADTDDFSRMLPRRQKSGATGQTAAALRDWLSTEEVQSLRQKHDPYAEYRVGMEYCKKNDALLRDLVELGVITAEESLLCDYGAGVPVVMWRQRPDGSWSARMRKGGTGGGPDFATIARARQSYMTALDGLVNKVDVDDARFDDVTLARAKVYDLLKQIFGAPSEAQSHSGYLKRLQIVEVVA